MENISTQSGLNGFIIKLVLFAAVVVVMDRAAGFLLEKYYFSQKGGYDYLTTEAMEKTTADIIAFGSSRAVNIFDTRLVTERTGMSSYNAGRYGEPVFYHFAVLKAVLKRHKPKLVLLSFDAGNFNTNEESHDRIAALLPYYASHPEIRDMVELKSPYEKLKLWSASYPYNSLVLPIVTGNRPGSKLKFANYKGFIPIKKTISGPLKKYDYTIPEPLSDDKINAYTNFIKTCQAANIPVVIICPPYMIDAKGVDQSVIKGKAIAKQLGVLFLDYTGDSSFTTQRQLFADFRHLNETGVGIFTNKLLDNLQQSHLAGF